MVNINELIQNYEIKFNYLPKTLLELEIPNELEDYYNGEKKNQKTVFLSKYSKDGIKAECEVIINTTNVNMSVVKELEDFVVNNKVDENIKELVEKELMEILFTSVVSVTIKNDTFTALKEYNVYGGIINQS